MSQGLQSKQHQPFRPFNSPHSRFDIKSCFMSTTPTYMVALKHFFRQPIIIASITSAYPPPKGAPKKKVRQLRNKSQPPCFSLRSKVSYFFIPVPDYFTKTNTPSKIQIIPKIIIKFGRTVSCLSSFKNGECLKVVRIVLETLCGNIMWKRPIKIRIAPITIFTFIIYPLLFYWRLSPRYQVYVET